MGTTKQWLTLTRFLFLIFEGFFGEGRVYWSLEKKEERVLSIFLAFA